MPTPVSGLSGVVSIASGGHHALALKGDRTVWSWGYNDIGQLGDGTTTSRTSPVQVSVAAGAPLTDVVAICTPKTGTTGLVAFTSPSPLCNITYGTVPVIKDGTKFDATPGSKEVFLGNSSSPRLSIGIGFNWVSPFGPLRIDIAKAILKQKGDDTKIFSFNVGTSF